MVPLLYLVCAVLVGCLAIGQRGGFSVFFVLSLGLTPIFALLVLVLMAPGTIARGGPDDDRACRGCGSRRRG